MRGLTAVSTSIFGGGSEKAAHAPHSRRCLGLCVEEKAFTRRLEVKGLPDRGVLPWLLLLCLVPGSEEKMGPPPPRNEGCPSVLGLWRRTGLVCSDISDPVILLVICRPQLTVCTSVPLAAFTSHTCFIWPMQGFCKYLIGCHLNIGKFCIKMWISGYC